MTLNKNLLAGVSALAIVASAGAVQAQSVLQEILEETATNLTEVSTVLANVAASLGEDIDNAISVTVGLENAIAGSFEITGQEDGELGELATFNGVGAIQAEVAALTTEIGDLTGTTIGAVNTGEIFTGANIVSITDEIDETSSASTANTLSQVNDINNSVTVLTGQIGQGLGGDLDPLGAIALNEATNTADITAGIAVSVTNAQLIAGNATSTAIGAVNTGTITSGIGGQISDIVSLD